MTIGRELQRSHRSCSFTLERGKSSPRCARSFVSESRAECLHLRRTGASTLAETYYLTRNRLKPT